MVFFLMKLPLVPDASSCSFGFSSSLGNGHALTVLSTHNMLFLNNHISPDSISQGVGGSPIKSSSRVAQGGHQVHLSSPLPALPFC